MTLIPMISAILSAPEATTAPAGRAPRLARGGYDPGGGYRPVAAALAIGLPAALVVAVALSPMIVRDAPKSDPILGTLIEVERPKPPEPKPEATEDAKPRASSTTETVDRVIPTVPTGNQVDPGPKTFDLGPPDPGPFVAPADPPPPPKLVLAQLDQRYLAGFQPDYPAREQRGGVEGVVRVRVLIGTDGRVKAVELVSTDSPGFFEATKRRALTKWRFKPATRGGVAEESWKEMTVRFEIKNA